LPSTGGSYPNIDGYGEPLGDIITPEYDARLEWSIVEQSGAEWSRVEQSGAEWSRVEQSGAEWSRVE
jgi:hypothetical protein